MDASKTEWVATFHKNNGTFQIAYRNPAALAAGLVEQTSEGWVCTEVYVEWVHGIGPNMARAALKVLT